MWSLANTCLFAEWSTSIAASNLPENCHHLALVSSSGQILLSLLLSAGTVDAPWWGNAAPSALSRWPVGKGVGPSDRFVCKFSKNSFYLYFSQFYSLPDLKQLEISSFTFSYNWRQNSTRRMHVQGIKTWLQDGVHGPIDIQCSHSGNLAQTPVKTGTQQVWLSRVEASEPFKWLEFWGWFCICHPLTAFWQQHPLHWDLTSVRVKGNPAKETARAAQFILCAPHLKLHRWRKLGRWRRLF